MLDGISLSYESVLAIKIGPSENSAHMLKIREIDKNAPVRTSKGTCLAMEAGDMLDNLSMIGKHLGRSRGAEKTYIDLTLPLVERKPDTILDASPSWKKAY